MRAREFISEKWSNKYKRSINCSNPKGFSQRAHCQGRTKEDIDLDERKKRKRQFGAYGPGPYGYYGFSPGYNGDNNNSGGDSGGESIQELFDDGKEWKWTYQDKNQAMAEFTVGKVHYTFSAVQDPDEAPGDWDIEFAAKQSAGTASWGVTGTGNSAHVFGTIVDIMKSFIKSKKSSIRRMTFAAKEDSRQGLYARMVKRLLPKWNLEQKGEAFILTRPGGLIFWVYSVEEPYNKIPPVKVKANSSTEAEQIVLTTMPEFKGADLMGLAASKNKPNLGENFADGRNLHEKVQDYLWHGSKSEHEILYPRQAQDTGGAEGSNKNAVYATPNAKVAIAMGLTTPGSDTGMFPNDPQMVLFKGEIRKGEYVYLHKVPKDLFIKHNSREWYSKPDVKEITPIEIKAIPVNKWLHLIRQATPQDLELQKKYMKENFADGRNPQDKGDSKRHGVPTKASVSTLRKVAKQGGRKGQLAHWMANMKAGRAKKNK